MMLRPLRLERLLTLLILLLFLAALTVPLYTLSFNNSMPSTFHPLNLIPRTDLSGSWSDTPVPDKNDLSSTCRAHSHPTTSSDVPQYTPDPTPSASATASAIPQCLYNKTGCGAIFSLIQTCYESLFPDSSSAYTITPGNPAQAARLRDCMCSSPSSYNSSASSAASKNAAWTHCLSCLYSDTHASQTDMEMQSRALRAFCQAPGVPDAVGWLREFERWIAGLAPGALAGGGGEKPVLSGGITAVLTMTATAMPTDAVTPAMATQTQTEPDSSTKTTAAKQTGKAADGDVVTSIYSVNGRTTLLIVEPAPTTASGKGSGDTESSSASRSATHRTTAVSTTAATTMTMQASEAARRFQAPPVGNGDMAFGIGLGVFVFLGVIRLLLD